MQSTESMMNCLRINFQKDPSTLDPRKCGDFISSAAIFLLYKGLTRLEADHKISYDLAESVRISQNGKVYEFHLGEFYWSDGKPIVASDFESSWKKVLSPDFPSLSAHLFYPIKNAENAKKGLTPLKDVGIFAKHPKVLVVELEYPTPYFLELLGFCSFFPVPSHEEENISSIYSGAFKLKHWKKGEEILLERNDRCRNLYPVSLDQIQILITPDERLALSKFEQGDLDWIGDPISPLPLDSMADLLQKKQVKPVGGITSCFFNTQQFPFHNLNLRKAFSFAIQRERILEKLRLPHAHRATSPVPPLLKQGENSSFFEEGKTEEARQLFQKAMEELKIKPYLLNLKLCFESSEIGFRLAKELQQDWEQAFGISIKWEAFEFKEFYEKLSTRQYQIAFTRWAAQYQDPMNILERFKFLDNSKNFSGWENQEYIHLLNRYMKTPHAKTRQEIVSLAEKLLIDHMPVAPIYYFSYAYLQKPYVKNLVVSPIGVFHFDRATVQP